MMTMLPILLSSFLLSVTTSLINNTNSTINVTKISHDNDITYFDEWNTVQITDLNLQKSKAIYSQTVNNGQSSGIWILGGILNDGSTISDSISFLDFNTHDTTTYDDFLDETSDKLPFAIYCTHQCSTTTKDDDIVIVSPYTYNDNAIPDLLIFHSSTINFTTLSIELLISHLLEHKFKFYR